ncbi:hypothetical protein BN1708_002506 [Verticillium longisporum]|uniref:NAD(P)-binding domain-containing protein n=1 Tax=Verticillium longisporum TaxID=100787 RepID=A0A0G4KTX8_VERLO|nr:hypothetical protein BN1708_002506 [Verticillium longisporum]
MRVAIAGSGDFARYLSEELVAGGFQVTILTRSVKPHFENRPGVTQFVTDYSVASIVEGIQDSTVLISAILDYGATFIDVHLRLIDACKQSLACKRFIPAEYGGNLEKFPDQPGFYYRVHEPVRKALREQTELEWTLIAVGWFVDYIMPSHSRYLKDAGDAFPINLTDGKILIPGTGDEPLDVTTALVRSKYPDLTVEYRSLYQLIENIVSRKDDFTTIIAEYQIFSVSQAGSLDPAKVAAHRDAYFQGVKFRSVQEMLEDAEKHPESII